MKKKVTVVFFVAFILSSLLMATVGCGQGNDSKEERSLLDSAAVSLIVAEASIEEQVLVDQKGIKITLKGIKATIFGDNVQILLEIENGTIADLSVGCFQLVVNNYMIDSMFFANIASGERETYGLEISPDDLKAAGIKIIEEIDIHFYASVLESEELVLDSDCVMVSFIKNSDIEIFTNRTDEGKELLNRNGIRIIGDYDAGYNRWGDDYDIFIENKSGEDVIIESSNVTVNGRAVDPVFACAVNNNKISVISIRTSSSYLGKIGYERIDEIELTLYVLTPNNRSTIDISDPIVFLAE